MFFPDINECERNASRCDNVDNGSLCLNLEGSVTCSACQAQDNTVWTYYERGQCCSRSKPYSCSFIFQNLGKKQQWRDL